MKKTNKVVRKKALAVIVNGNISTLTDKFGGHTEQLAIYEEGQQFSEKILKAFKYKVIPIEIKYKHD